MATKAVSAQELLIRAGSGVFVLRLVAVALALGVEILLTNTLGTEQYGYWAVGLSWLAILTVVTTLGMNTAVVRFLPAELAKGRTSAAAGVIRYTGRAMLMCSVVVAGLFALGSSWLIRVVYSLNGSAAEAQRPVFWVIALMIPIQALNLHRQAVLQGLKYPVQALLPDSVIRLAGLAALLFLATQLTSSVGALEASLALGGGVLIAFLFGQCWKWKLTPHEVRNASPVTDHKGLWRVALPLAWIGVMNLMFTTADPAMIGWLSTPEEAGLYAVAARVANLLLFGLLAVNAIIAPMISEFHSTGEREELQRVLTTAAKGIALYTLPLAAALFLFGPQILSLFGEDFQPANQSMRWLVLGQCVSALAGSVGLLLTMTGHERVVARILTGCALGKVALNLVLIPLLDAQGAAIASGIVLVAWNLLLYREVRKRTQFEPSCLAIVRSGARSTASR
jgi:O-antigen/teichoic acid export membrane protein